MEFTFAENQMNHDLNKIKYAHRQNFKKVSTIPRDALDLKDKFC